MQMDKWNLFGAFLTIALVLCTVQCQTSPDMEPTTDGPKESEIHARQLWLQTDKTLKALMNKVMRKAMPVVMKEVYKKDISTTCLSSLLSVASALKQSKDWAFLMLDSSGRIPEGFFYGTLTSFGNYDECVGIDVNEKKLKLKGQYCYVQIQPPIPVWKPFTSMHGTVPELRNISSPDSVITYMAKMFHNLHVVAIRVGICTPSMCSKDDINQLIQIIPEKLGIKWDFTVKHCETLEELHFTYSQLVALYVLGTMILFILIGTVIDLKYTSEEMERKSYKLTLYQIAKSFSVVSNAKKISDWTCPQEKLGFVYGLIFLVYYWVVISNTFMYVNYDVIANFQEAFRIFKLIFYEIVLNRVMPLQILFFISGLVTTYRWLKCPDETLNIWKFFLKKYWRYTPAYGLIIGLLLISPTWGSGPTWIQSLNPLYKNCRDNWWYNLLYINNFKDSSQVCLDHTWVFAVFAQLHVLSVVILIPLKIRPKIGLMVNFVLAVTSLASVALTNVYYDLPPNEALAFLSVKDRMYYSEHSYFRVYTHLTMYCSGIFVAYLVHEYPNLKVSKKMCWFLWITTFIGLSAAFCVVHEWRLGNMPSPLVGAVYSSFSKVAEAAFIAWLSIACMTGHGGLIKEFLSWRPFHFLSRLSFIAYLMHVPIMTLVNGFKKSHLFLSQFDVFYVTLNNVAATLVISYLLFILFEAPFLSLTRVLSKYYRSRLCSNEVMTTAPMTEKPIKFADKPNNVGVTPGAPSPEPKVWLNICEKSRC